MMYFFVAELKHGSIQMDSFAAYVKLMHTDGDYRFNQEFEVKSMIFMIFEYYNLAWLSHLLQSGVNVLCINFLQNTVSVHCQVVHQLF